jgi:hypothetical protein
MIRRSNEPRSRGLLFRKKGWSKSVVFSFSYSFIMPRFQDTTNQCIKSTTEKLFFVIADAGPDSHLSNKTVIKNGIIPIIAARANSFGNVLKTEKRNSFQSPMHPKNLP